MRTTSNGRVYRSREEWDELLTRQERSGRTESDFCKREGVALTTFQKWQRRLRESKFVELTPAGEFRRAVEIVFSDGTVLRLER